MTMPPIPRQRAAITAEISRCAGTRADAQHRIVDDLCLIDAVTRRLDDLMDALLEVTP